VPQWPAEILGRRELLMMNVKATKGDGIGAVRRIRNSSIWIFSEFESEFRLHELQKDAHLRFSLIANGSRATRKQSGVTHPRTSAFKRFANHTASLTLGLQPNDTSWANCAQST
jgi:hypothetical protein